MIYVLDVFRARLEMPELVRKAVELAQLYRPDYLFVEDKASGEGLIKYVQKDLPRNLWPLPCNPKGDKTMRAEGVSPIVENGRLFLPSEAAWLGEFKSELLGFPNVRYYDQVDALTQMLEWVRTQDAQPPPLENAGPELMDPNGSGGGDWDDDFDEYINSF